MLAAETWDPATLATVRDRAAALAGAEPVLVVVTSGSSGAARAVVRTTASWQHSLPGFDTLLDPPGRPGCGPGDAVWVPGAPASTLTLFGLWHAVATGRPVIATGRWRGVPRGIDGPPHRAADATASPLAVQCVPAVLADILQIRARGGLPGLRRAVVAGAAVPATLRRRAADLGIEPAEYYGAAELSFVAADRDGAGLRAFPGAELAVRDGEIWVRSPYLARGYLDPATGGPLRRDPDGWATVGDRGTLAPDGVLQVRGRGDDTASVAGHVVLLDDVERALADAPGVAEVVCLAVPDRRFGQRVLAVLRPDPGITPDAVTASARAAARERLPAPARPARLSVREQLPRTPGGKVARAELAAELGLGSAAEPDFELGGGLRAERPAPRRTLPA